MNWFSKLPGLLARTMRALSPTCREAARLQSRALDGPLPLLEHLGLRLHRLLCRWCRRYGRHLKFLHDAARRDPEQQSAPVPQTLSVEARQRIRERLAREAGASCKDSSPRSTDSLN